MNLKSLIKEDERLYKDNAGLRMKDQMFKRNSYVLSGIKKAVEAVDDMEIGMALYKNQRKDWQKLKKLLGVK